MGAGRPEWIVEDLAASFAVEKGLPDALGIDALAVGDPTGPFRVPITLTSHDGSSILVDVAVDPDGTRLHLTPAGGETTTVPVESDFPVERLELRRDVLVALAEPLAKFAAVANGAPDPTSPPGTPPALLTTGNSGEPVATATGYAQFATLAVIERFYPGVTPSDAQNKRWHRRQLDIIARTVHSLPQNVADQLADELPESWRVTRLHGSKALRHLPRWTYRAQGQTSALSVATRGSLVALVSVPGALLGPPDQQWRYLVGALIAAANMTIYTELRNRRTVLTAKEWGRAPARMLHGFDRRNAMYGYVFGALDASSRAGAGLLTLQGSLLDPATRETRMNRVAG